MIKSRRQGLAVSSRGSCISTLYIPEKLLGEEEVTGSDLLPGRVIVSPPFFEVHLQMNSVNVSALFTRTRALENQKRCIDKLFAATYWITTLLA